MAQACLQAFLATLLTLAVSTNAQSMIGLPATTLNTGDSTRLFSDTKSTPPSDFASAFPNTGPLAQLGPLSVRPHLLYRLSFGDGLLLPEQLEPQSSTIHSITAGTLFELGKHWTLNYALSRVMYSNRFIRDSTDQSTDIEGGISGNDWTIAMFLTHRASTPLLVQTGRQSEESTNVTRVEGTYRLGHRSILESSLTRNTRLVDDTGSFGQWTAIDWRSWTISSGVNYHFSPRLSGKLGVEATYDDLEIGPDMNSTRPHIKVSWKPTNKVSLSAQAGTESRRIKERDARQISNPVYSASVEYRPLNVTSLTLSATQNVSASYFANQASKTSNWGLILSQRLLQRFYLNAGFGHGENTYLATASNFVAGRDDEFTTYHARLSTTVLSRGTLALFFQRSHNSSNTVEFGFSSIQFGTELGYRF